MSAQGNNDQKKKPPAEAAPVTEISKTRKNVARLVALIVGIGFVITVLIIVEARSKSFYGEPLVPKMIEVAKIKINGLPSHPDQRASAITAIPNLLLLPPKAVLPTAPAERFARIGTQFGFVTEDTQLGTRYICAKSDLKRIPRIALNIAMGLEHFPEDLLRKVKMEYIVFCGDLRNAEGSVAGLPAPPNNVMLLNLTNRDSDRQIRELFFHEFYHLFEDRFGLVRDQEWLRRFDAGYHHGRQSLEQYKADRIGSGGFGFLNNYSRSHPYEDRAEIFSMLMVSKSYLTKYIMKNKDDLLAAKTEYVSNTAKKHLGIDFEPLWTK